MKYPFIALIFSASLAACGQQSPNNTDNTAPIAASNGMTFAHGKGSISEDRSAAFKSFMPTFSEMRKMANGDTAFEPEKFKAAAERFTQEARAPFDSFQNDPNGNGDAMPAIWLKPVEFKSEQDKFLAAVDKLNTAAQGGKLDDIKVAFGEAANSCQSCHDSYRKPK
ncbi:MAG: cytochrome c [Alysiella sp.]|uniref:c-type cytochrome n=1 Tax=Alysiella sp. TaxID=1872483 RepID=UPI0026DCCD74|nr:cytochrome c [Alysiella sp.]MDO4433946.1 cytochrome c [Alysiella sp.]